MNDRMREYQKRTQEYQNLFGNMLNPSFERKEGVDHIDSTAAIVKDWLESNAQTFEMIIADGVEMALSPPWWVNDPSQFQMYRGPNAALNRLTDTLQRAAPSEVRQVKTCQNLWFGEAGAQMRFGNGWAEEAIHCHIQQLSPSRVSITASCIGIQEVREAFDATWALIRETWLSMPSSQAIQMQIDEEGEQPPKMPKYASPNDWNKLFDYAYRLIEKGQRRKIDLQEIASWGGKHYSTVRKKHTDYTDEFGENSMNNATKL